MDLSKLHLHWRSCKRVNKEYRSYSLARAYRENGKNRKEIVLKLGALSTSDVEQWRNILQMVKNPTTMMRTDLNNLITISNHAYLDVAVALEVWNSWGFNDIFSSNSKKKKRSVELSSLAAILAINRCIDPASKSKVCSWVKKTTLPLLLGVVAEEINPTRIYRELPLIESCKDQLSQHICRKINQDDPESLQSLFYDLSSTTFTGARCILTKWGHCKEGYEYHIVLALIVNAKGIPIYWEVLEGGTADATTISWLLNRLKEKLSVAIPIPIMVFDRGMVSDDNLALLEKESIKYITAMDKNQIESTMKTDFFEFKKLTVESVEQEFKKLCDFVKLDENTYCKEACMIGERRYILCFNLQLFKDQRKAREDQIINFQDLAKELNENLLKVQINRDKKSTQDKFDSQLRKAKIKSFVKAQLEEKWVPKQTKKMLKAIRSYQCTVSIDEVGKLEDGKLDGFWMLVTNLSEKTGDTFIQETKAIVRPYREKVIIESSFRDIKSYIEISPVHVWKPEHVRAHYTLCVLAHIVNRTLSIALHKRRSGHNKEIVSHERLYEELEGCRLNHHRLEGVNQDFYKLTQPTKIQTELLNRLRMANLTTETAVKKLINR